MAEKSGAFDFVNRFKLALGKYYVTRRQRRSDNKIECASAMTSRLYGLSIVFYQHTYMYVVTLLILTLDNSTWINSGKGHQAVTDVHDGTSCIIQPGAYYAGQLLFHCKSTLTHTCML